MQFQRLGLGDITLITLDERKDDRGFFARLFCCEEFQAQQLCTKWEQINTSLTKHKGTVRGLHFQRPPSAEVKLVRCIAGAIFDVAVDLREGSDTYGHWMGVELNIENRQMLYIPAGFAHGFQALEDNSEIIYFNSMSYSPQLEGGLRCNDSSLNIDWPLPISGQSERDRLLPDLSDLEPIILNTR
jgi:dTDP-4-dehydrorhamnose 3,5-epimerase